MDELANAADLGNKKGCPWSEEEHRDFLRGLQSLGKGNWRGISRMFVPSRNPTQVASHAQKYFLRLSGCTKRRSRFSGLEQGTSSRSARASGGRSSNTSTGSGSSPASSCGAGSDDQMSPLLMMAVEAERRLSLPGGREAPQPPTLLPPAAAAAMMMPPPPLPPFMMPPPHMAMFAGPGGAPFFAPVFFAPPGYGNQGMMLPMLPMGPPLAAVAGPRGKAPVKEGGADSFRSEEAAAALAAHLAALCNAFKPAARPARREDDGLFGRLGCFEAAAEPTTTAAQHGCHIALRASACSAFRPAARQLASA